MGSERLLDSFAIPLDRRERGAKPSQPGEPSRPSRPEEALWSKSGVWEC